MIDTNIFWVLNERKPFYAASRAALDLCERKKVQGFLSASSVTDIFYLIHRQLHSIDLAYQALGSVLDIAKVLTVTNDDVLNAYIARASDFENCLLATCAKSNKCDAIVTRNKKRLSDVWNHSVITGRAAKNFPLRQGGKRNRIITTCHKKAVLRAALRKEVPLFAFAAGRLMKMSGDAIMIPGNRYFFLKDEKSPCVRYCLLRSVML